jgi:hypothetical protein
MKVNNISNAFEKLDYYTLNNIALNEINRITSEGNLIKIPNETIYDRLINFIDYKRILLEKKSTILNNLYKDTPYNNDLVNDFYSKIKHIDLVKNLTIFGLFSYNVFTSLYKKSPFLKFAGLMVSTIRYSSFKTLDFKGRVPFLTIVLAVFLIAAVALEPAEMLFAIFFIYLISGPIMTLWQLRQMRKKRSQSTLRQVGRKPT